MQKLLLLLAAFSSIALLAGCQAGEDGAPENPNAAQATTGGTADPAANTENQPEGTKDASETSSTSPDPKAGLNPNAQIPTR